MPLSHYAAWILLATTSASPEAPRHEFSLNGNWQYQHVTELQEPPQTGEWAGCRVPSTLHGYDYERVWFRRSFELPSGMRNKRITVHFDGVKYNSRIYVNGQHVGGCFNGYDAFDVDITEAVRFDAVNEIAVGCHDWTGVFSEGKVDFSKKPDWQRPRRFVEDKVIAPIGGHCDYYGIWGDVLLEAHPGVYVKDLFIKPSVRRQELVVDYTVVNETSQPIELTVRPFVEDAGEDCLELPIVPIRLKPGRTARHTVRQPWSKARYWSHEDPYLYQLRTELSSGDVLRTRFGFREFWIEGHRYILNGSPVNLLASSWWPPTEAMSRDEVETQYRKLKAAGVMCFRTHTQPWRRVHYDVADEIGLLMIIEGAMWHDPYCTAYHDPTYWDNYAKMIRAMIQREKNRPSVIMWSMENEAYSGEEKTKLAIENLARVGKMTKQWDPTRPIYFESDGDPGGVADAIGMHYVHEYPQHTCWPNEAYWLDRPFHPHTWFGLEEDAFVWKRDKPLYIGEFLWVPSGTPANHTVFFGDDAYKDLHEYTRRGKAEAWKMQILAFRHHEAGGICPWTVGTDLDETNPLYRAHQYAYQPIAAYTHDYDRRFYAGDNVTRRVEVFNDILTPSNLRFEWTASCDDQVVAFGAEPLSLEAGGKQMLNVAFEAPTVASRSPMAWKLVLRRDGKQIFEDTHHYSIFPKLQLPRLSASLGLYDPRGATAGLFTQYGLTYDRVASLDQVTRDYDVLVIGDGALSGDKSTTAIIGRIDPRRDAIMKFVAQGGCVFVLRQDAYPEGLFDLGLTQQKSTMTFPLRPSHAALVGLAEDDLKFWRGDHTVTDRELPRPSAGATVSIVVSGSKAGLANAPLLERPLGRGTMIHCQMKLVELAAVEPSAGLILANVLTYLAEYSPVSRKTGVLGADAEYQAQLQSLGLRFEDLSRTLNTVDLSDFSLVVARDLPPESLSSLPKLRAFVQQGGNLLVHRPSTTTLDRLCEALSIECTSQPFVDTAYRGESDHPLQEAIAREDLYWSVKKPGLSWARQPLSREMMDGVFSPRFDAAQSTTYEAETWNLEGVYVEALATSAHFASQGSARKEIDFPDSGKYGFGIRARGTPCQGVFPIAQFSVDGKPLGSVQLDGSDWQVRGVSGDVPKGRHTIAVTFINDASAPPNEDRNLEIDHIYIGRDRRADDCTALTAPAAVVVVNRGAGNVVFDHLRWDTEQNNGQKASRYATSILTALKADFTPRPSVALQCIEMTPQPDLKHFNRQGNIAYMGTNGFIKTTIDVAESRRFSAQLVAGGEASEGICPLVEVHIDGKMAAEVQLVTEGWRAYPFELELEKGEHELSLHFMNDHYAPSGDRNLRLDRIVFFAD